MPHRFIPARQPLDGILALVALIAAVACFLAAHIFVEPSALELKAQLDTVAGMLLAFAGAALARYRGLLPGAEPAEVKPKGDDR